MKIISILKLDNLRLHLCVTAELEQKVVIKKPEASNLRLHLGTYNKKTDLKNIVIIVIIAQNFFSADVSVAQAKGRRKDACEEGMNG